MLRCDGCRSRRYFLGCEGETLMPDFLPCDPVPGFILDRTRGHIYRATTEALTQRHKQRPEKQEKAGTELLLVGSTCNKIRTQMRANIPGSFRRGGIKYTGITRAG